MLEAAYIYTLIGVGCFCFIVGRIKDGCGYCDSLLLPSVKEDSFDETDALPVYGCCEVEGMCEGCGKEPPCFQVSSKEPVKLGGQVIAPACSVELCLGCSKNLIQRRRELKSE